MNFIHIHLVVSSITSSMLASAITSLCTLGSSSIGALSMFIVVTFGMVIVDMLDIIVVGVVGRTIMIEINS